MTGTRRRSSSRVLAIVALVVVVASSTAAGLWFSDGGHPDGVVGDRRTSTIETATAGAGGTATSAVSRGREVESLELRVISTADHDPGSFTQGLVFAPDGRLFESAGRYGDSDVRQVNPETGQVIREVPLPVDVFAEGLAIGPDGLVQLTWKEGRAFRWNPDDLGALGEWQYRGEGWGLTYDPADRTFLRSDGTSTISRHDAATFSEVDRVEVTRGGQPVDELNELELVDGVLYANVWRSSEILRIDPRSGVVSGVIDASEIVPTVADADAVLNGIAHRPGDPPNRLLVTGKNWPAMYVVDVGTR